MDCEELHGLSSVLSWCWSGMLPEGAPKIAYRKVHRRFGTSSMSVTGLRSRGADAERLEDTLLLSRRAPLQLDRQGSLCSLAGVPKRYNLFPNETASEGPCVQKAFRDFMITASANGKVHTATTAMTTGSPIASSTAPFRTIFC